MDPFTVLLIVAGIWIVIYIVAQAIGVEKLSEKGVDASFPLFLMVRTERLNNFLTRMGKKFPRAFFNLGIVVSFVGMVYGFWLFTDNLIKFFIQPAAAGGVVPIIPGVTVSGLPLIYILIGLAVTLLTHEFAHGLASAKDNIPIKSSGLLFFYVMFGGFVEPDEEAFENDVGPKERMRLLAAGSFANLIWGLVFLILIANFQGMMAIGFNPPSGAYIYDIESESPADGVLEIGDVIIGLNGTTISSWADIGTFMTDAHSGSQLTIYTTDNTYTIILAANDLNASKGYIGIYGADYWEPKPGWEWIPGGPLYAFHMQQILVWCFIILVSVGIFNLLPIPMLDGDRLLSNGLSLVIDDEKLIMKIMWPLRIVSLGILLLSIVLSLITGKGLF
jgi:membrane-associated protease RseP (regulator of RpoE activity)